MKTKTLLKSLALLPCLLSLAAGAVINGERKQWHDITLTFTGPATSETATPNPFLNYRLNVTFTKGAKTLVVPGYFAADGNAAETSATAGNCWRAHFVPDETGTWAYRASFRTGPEVAVSLEENAGTPTAFDGESGTIEVGPTDKTGRDFRGRGMLQYASGHFLRFGGTGEFLSMVGTQSPENFLGYFEFDNTVDHRGQKGLPYPDQLHHYDPHVQN